MCGNTPLKTWKLPLQNASKRNKLPGVVAHTFGPQPPGDRRSGAAWSTQRVLGKPGLHPVSLKKRKEKEQIHHLSPAEKCRGGRGCFEACAHRRSGQAACSLALLPQPPSPAQTSPPRAERSGLTAGPGRRPATGCSSPLPGPRPPSHSPAAGSGSRRERRAGA